jgi:hypothetical protein
MYKKEKDFKKAHKYLLWSYLEVLSIAVQRLISNINKYDELHVS